MTRRARALVAITLVALAVGCASPTLRSTQAPTLTASPLPPRSSLPPPTPTPQSTRSAGAPPQLSVEPFASGFSNLTFVTNSGDGSGSLYAIEQVGRIRLATPGSTQGGQAFLDLTDRVSAGGERGLLGLAFDPNFASNGRFFVDYTNLSGNTVISRFTRAADGTVDPGAETIVLTVDQPFPNHNGGMLAFGADGDLYIGLGDGGSEGDPQGNGQNLDTLLAKILRIDVESGSPYAIPADNPFVSGRAAGGPARPEIWDYGVRNPWRFSFDRQTGALFIGDVGQDAYEEVDVEQLGSGRHDYGWSVMEGLHCYGASTCNQTGFTLPAVEYPHSLGCAVTGGYVYRGLAYPSLAGSYVFGDYCSGRLFAFNADDALAGRPVAVLQVGQVPFSISSFGQDEAGELYVVDLAGAINRLTAQGSLANLRG
jgi:glucose/arabinose dehydrogenase